MTNDNNLGGWLATAQYVVPIEDLKYHDAGKKSCWCHPILNNGLLIHNSMDKREEYERKKRKSS